LRGENKRERERERPLFFEEVKTASYDWIIAIVGVKFFFFLDGSPSI
jgi:hypothetical protein